MRFSSRLRHRMGKTNNTTPRTSGQCSRVSLVDAAARPVHSAIRYWLIRRCMHGIPARVALDVVGGAAR